MLRTVYSNWWLTLTLNRVEKPDGSVVEHEVVRGPSAAAMVAVDDDHRTLMIWRHRFMPDTWGWEVPGGAVDDGESPDVAAVRECREETGWEVSGPLQHLSRHHPSCGLLAQTFDLYLARSATRLGEPEDVNEAGLVAWRTPQEIAADMKGGDITDGLTQLGLALAFAALGESARLAELPTAVGGS
ncbi:MAG: NUDIX hydrolase [Actinomycetota bacterium]